MNYAIVGFGAVGQALAKMFARKDIAVTVATTKPPGQSAGKAKAIGPTVVAGTLADAAGADVILLAVPFPAHRDVAAAADWRGKTVIDVTNSYGVPPEDLGGLPSSEVVARAFKGATIVKAFNHLDAATLAKDPAAHGGKRVIFVSGDDEAAVASVAKLIGTLGFAPAPLGALSVSEKLVQAHGETWGPLIFQDFIKFDEA